MVKETKYYDMLGVPPTATMAELADAYRILSLKYNTGRNINNKEAFSQISQVYEILSNPEKRNIYDQGGEVAIRMDGVMTPTEIFEKFFEWNAPTGKILKPSGLNIIVLLPVTLDEFYNSVLKVLTVDDYSICAGCDGRGGMTAVKRCTICYGHGTLTNFEEIAPIRFQETDRVCYKCLGHGSTTGKRRLCKMCDGAKVLLKQKQLLIPIAKGMNSCCKFTFPGEGSRQRGPRGVEVGDFIVFLKEIEHPFFYRIGNDLLIKAKIKLAEAACGFRSMIYSLDGRPVPILTGPNDFIQEGDMRCLFGEGMPIYNNNTQKGKLIVEFFIALPRGIIINGMQNLGPNLPQRLELVIPVSNRKGREHQLKQGIYTLAKQENELVYFLRTG